MADNPSPDDDQVAAAVSALVQALAATPDEAVTLMRQVLDAEVAIIVTADGAVVQPVKGKAIRIEDA